MKPMQKQRESLMKMQQNLQNNMLFQTFFCKCMVLGFFILKGITSVSFAQDKNDISLIGKAISICEKNKSKYFINELSRAPACVLSEVDHEKIKSITLESLSDALIKSSLEKTCAGPVDFACNLEKKVAAVVDSNCKVVVNHFELLEQTPEYSDFLDGKKNCNAQDVSCIQALVYTPERLKKASNTIANIKGFLTSVIQSSLKLSKEKQDFLINKIKNIDIVDPAKMIKKNACMDPANLKSSLGFGISMNPKNEKITFCAGSMIAFDRMPEISLVYSLAHEIAHLIDPCTIDRSAFDLKNLSIKNGSIGTQFYGSLIECLRKGGIKNNDPRGVDKYCKLSDDPVLCQAEIRFFPNCPFSSEFNQNNEQGSTTRNLEYSVNQISEAFPDTIAAQVMNLYVQQRDRKDNPSGSALIKTKLNDLIALGEDYSKLHGDCATKDESLNGRHPSGKTRVNWLFLGNDQLNNYYCSSFKENPKVLKPNHCGGI